MNTAMLIKKGGGGGGALNYKVVGGLTRPENTSENMIWIPTASEITSHVFSADEPATPSQGMVWIRTGLSSSAPFNAIKNDTLMVYPQSAAQHIDGAWAGLNAEIYISGEWISWAVYLIQNGVDNTEVTGGWICAGQKFLGGEGTQAPVLSNADGLFTLTHNVTVNWGVGGMAYMQNKIDCTELTSIEVICPVIDFDRVSADMYAWTAIGDRIDKFKAASATLHNATSPIILDVSSLSGEHYIGFGFYTQKGQAAIIGIKDMIPHKK